MKACSRTGAAGHDGSAKAPYDAIKAFSETDQTDDPKAITVPTLVLHGEDDPVVPIAAERFVEDLSRCLARDADSER